MAKEILKDEILSDSKLDGVAGGSYNETGADTRFLNDLAGLCNRIDNAMFYPTSASKEAVKGWNKIGISIETNYSGQNKYFLNGQEITRTEAFEYACNKYGVKLQDMPGGYYLPQT